MIIVESQMAGKILCRKSFDSYLKTKGSFGDERRALLSSSILVRRLASILLYVKRAGWNCRGKRIVPGSFSQRCFVASRGSLISIVIVGLFLVSGTSVGLNGEPSYKLSLTSPLNSLFVFALLSVGRG